MYLHFSCHILLKVFNVFKIDLTLQRSLKLKINIYFVKNFKTPLFLDYKTIKQSKMTL